MLVAQRHQKIVELVNERSSIRVTELCEIFSVTEETIRRDLEKLRKKPNFYAATAVPLACKKVPEIHFSKRVITNVKEKK